MFLIQYLLTCEKRFLWQWPCRQMTSRCDGMYFGRLVSSFQRTVLPPSRRASIASKCAVRPILKRQVVWPRPGLSISTIQDKSVMMKHLSTQPHYIKLHIPSTSPPNSNVCICTISLKRELCSNPITWTEKMASAWARHLLQKRDTGSFLSSRHP